MDTLHIKSKLQKLCTALTQNIFLLKLNIFKSQISHILIQLVQYIPLFETTILQKSFLYQGVKIRNSIPSYIRLLSYPKFKSLRKQMLFIDQ